MKRYVVMILLFIVLLQRETLFKWSVKYQTQWDISSGACSLLETEERNMATNINELIDQVLERTADHLSFDSQANSSTCQAAYETREAHCVGYAALTTQLLRSRLNSGPEETIWEVKHKRGRLIVLGIDIHPFIDSPMFRDHDYVIITEKGSGKQIAIDPVLYDYFRIKRISLVDGL